MSERFTGKPNEEMKQLELDLWIEPSQEELQEAEKLSQYWDALMGNAPMPIDRPSPEMREIARYMRDLWDKVQKESPDGVVIFKHKNSDDTTV